MAKISYNLRQNLMFWSSLMPLGRIIDLTIRSNEAPPIRERILHFLSDPNDAPAYGYQDNAVTGIGFWLMQGARFAVSL